MATAYVIPPVFSVKGLAVCSDDNDVSAKWVSRKGIFCHGGNVSNIDSRQRQLCIRAGRVITDREAIGTVTLAHALGRIIRAT